MEFREQQLDNGLQVIAECNPAAYSTALGFFVNTGSRDENGELWGVSHFLEHMVFKGTPKRSAADVNRELDELGSQSNAFTSEEQTVYYAKVLPELQSQVLELLCDILRPSLREEDFELEKQVILEEIAKYEDQPPYGAHEKCMAVHFGDHPLARSVLGTNDSVGSLTPEQMRGYFEHRYSPGNITLAAAGNVDFDQLADDAQRWSGSWQPYSAARETPAASGKTGFRLIEKPSSVQQYVVQVADGPAAEDEQRYAARLLSTIVGDDSGSRLFWDLVDTGLAEYASMGAYEFQGAGIMMTFLACEPDQASDNLARIRDAFVEVQRDGVTEAELTRAKSKTCSHIILQSERPTSRLFSVGSNWVQRREYKTVRQLVDSYRSITCDDIQQFLKRFPLTTNTTVAVGPLTELSV